MIEQLPWCDPCAGERAVRACISEDFTQRADGMLASGNRVEMSLHIMPERGKRAYARNGVSIRDAIALASHGRRAISKQVDRRCLLA